MSLSKTWSHLLGIPSRSLRASKAEDDGPIVEDYNNDDPLDQQYVDDDEDDKKAKGRKAKGKRAEDDDDADAEDDDDKPDAEDDDEKPAANARGKKAKRAEDDDDDAGAEDDEDDKKPSAARAAERERCARIMAYGMNHGMERQAFALAFDSNVSRATAVTVLKANKAATPKTAGISLGHSMASLGIRQVAPEASRELPAGADAAAAMIIKAGQ